MSPSILTTKTRKTNRARGKHSMEKIFQKDDFVFAMYYVFDIDFLTKVIT